jgi:hypothetical protein
MKQKQQQIYIDMNRTIRIAIQQIYPNSVIEYHAGGRNRDYATLYIEGAMELSDSKWEQAQQVLRDQGYDVIKAQLHGKEAGGPIRSYMNVRRAMNPKYTRYLRK